MASDRPPRFPATPSSACFSVPPPKFAEPPAEAKKPDALALLCGENEPTSLDLNGQPYATCCAVGPTTTLACTLTQASQHSAFLTSDLLFVARGDDFVGTTQCEPVHKLCASAGRYRWDHQGFPRRVP